MPEELDAALRALRPLLLDLDSLVRAVAAGRRRGTDPAYRRAELRPVRLKSGPRLQTVVTGAAPTAAPVTSNLTLDQAPQTVDALLGEPFGNWMVETDQEVRQLRVTKKGQAQVHVARSSRRDVQPRTGHDRVKSRLLDPADPLFDALGADADKRRQVDAFLRVLAPVVERAAARAREAARPLHVVDLGCGNAYLTFAAHRYLTARAGPHGVLTVGVDQRPDMVARNGELAERLTLEGLRFVPGTIESAQVDFGEAGSAEAGSAEASSDRAASDRAASGEVDVVLALHACDTATDDALARALTWRAPLVLAAPCCHHDLQRRLGAAQAAGHSAPHPYPAVTRYPILRERFADVLTDALRAGLLRLLGHRVDVIEFVDSRHTPRNALIRAELTDAPLDADRLAEYRDLTTAWGVTPRLAELLGLLEPPDRDLAARIDVIRSIPAAGS